MAIIGNVSGLIQSVTVSQEAETGWVRGVPNEVSNPIVAIGGSMPEFLADTEQLAASSPKKALNKHWVPA